MDFPSSPPIGTTASNGTRVWTWNGNAWDLSVALSTSFIQFVQIGPMVELSVDAMPSPIGKAWSLLNYI